MIKFKVGDERMGRKIIELLSKTGEVQWFKVKCLKCNTVSTMNSTSFKKNRNSECIHCYRKKYTKAGYGLIRATNKLQADRQR